MNLPVVATDVAGCVDAVLDGVTGLLVPARNSERLAIALRRYLEDVDLRREHGTAGRGRVLREFRQEAIWEAIYDQYDLLVGERRRARATQWEKRAFDLVLSLFGLLVLSLPLASLALLVRVCMGKPVLFRQVRPGLRGLPFVMYKFRTMIDASDERGEPLPDEYRLTGLGRFLRRTSLDELPELLNVLRGQMSLVGPRPLLMEYLPLYSPIQARRHEVKPGITGLAQVHGRNATTWERRLDLDIWYVDNRCMWLDIKIILRTLKTVMLREGISQDGAATMKRFRGSPI